MKSKITIEAENMTYEEFIEMIAGLVADTTSDLSEYKDFDVMIYAVKKPQVNAELARIIGR